MKKLIKSILLISMFLNQASPIISYGVGKDKEPMNSALQEEPQINQEKDVPQINEEKEVPKEVESNNTAIDSEDGLQISVDAKDSSAIKTKDSTLIVGEKWNKEDNFVSATDEDGKEIPFSDNRMTITGEVDTSKAMHSSQMDLQRLISWSIMKAKALL